MSATDRAEIYFGTRYYRQTLQSFDLALELNYTIFNFGARAGRIDAAKADLLAAQPNVKNAEAVQQAAEKRLENGLATPPDVLEARSGAAQVSYDLQATLGARDVAHGNLATALGVTPVEQIQVVTIDKLESPDKIEDTVDEAIDRPLKQRPDLMQRVAQIRAANAHLKEARAV